jgi:hypothetical protein
MSEKLVSKVLDVAFHRNGIMGDGFFVVLFMQGKLKMVGVVFPEIGQCAVAVLNVDMLVSDNIRFTENSWRGDQYQGELLDAIKEYRKNRE